MGTHQLRLALGIGLLLTTRVALAHDPQGHDGPHDDSSHAGAVQQATGVVFHDKNQNGTRDEGEPGLRDVRVSNGRDIVRTDAEGRYKIAVNDDTILFVIKPRDWTTPVDDDNLPQFYYVHKPAGSPRIAVPGRRTDRAAARFGRLPAPTALGAQAVQGPAVRRHTAA